MNEGAKDVTQRILDRHIVYGSSDYTNPAYASASKSLNYGEGGSIQKPQRDRVTIIPFKINYSDTVGLFGKENHFVRVDVAINKEYAFACFEEAGWVCAEIANDGGVITNTYQPGLVDITSDLLTVNDYEPATAKANSLVSKPDAYLSVDLNNIKTGNKYIDAWFDVRLYTKSRKEHPYDKMYVRLDDYFYIGFHARNTKRLPYNVDCVMGQEYISASEMKDSRYVNQ